MDKKQVLITGAGMEMSLKEFAVKFVGEDLKPWQEKMMDSFEEDHGHCEICIAEADMVKRVEEFTGFKQGEFIVIDSFAGYGSSRQQGMSELFQNMYDVEPGVPSTKAEYRKGLNTFLKGKRK